MEFFRRPRNHFSLFNFRDRRITNDRKNECVSLHCERQNGEQQDEKQEAIHRGPMTFRWSKSIRAWSRAAKQTNNRVGYCSFIARRNPYHQLHVWSHDAIVLLDDDSL